MRSIKFNTNQEALTVSERVFTDANADGKFAPGTTAYATPEKEEYFTIPVLEGFESYFTNVELSCAEMFKEEKQGRLVIDDLIGTQNISDEDMAILLENNQALFVAILIGRLGAAKIIINKSVIEPKLISHTDWLLTRLQTEIDKL